MLLMTLRHVLGIIGEKGVHQGPPLDTGLQREGRMDLIVGNPFKEVGNCVYSEP